MLQRSKGASNLIAVALYIGVVAGAVITVANFTQPILKTTSETNTIQEMMNKMPEIEDVYSAVASGGKGTRQTVSIGFQQGRIRFDKGEDIIEYVIDTQSSLVSPKSSKKFGNVQLSAGADVTVNKSTVNGTECWRLRNSHVEACIKSVPKIQKGLKGYWGFESEEQEVEDLSDYNNTGTLGSSTAEETNDPTWTSGKFDNALSFDGEDDIVEVTDNAETDMGTSDFTVTAWIKGDDFESGGKFVILGDGGVAGTEATGYRVAVENGEIGTWLVDGSTNINTVDVGSKTSLTNNQWYFVVWSFDRDGNVNEYLDGNLDNSYDISGFDGVGLSDSYNTYIGMQNNDAGYFDGKIDEVAIYDYAMSQEEINARYKSNIFKKSFFRTDNLLVSYNNTDTGVKLGNPEIRATINSEKSSSYGFGYTEAETLGRNLPEGKIDAKVKSLAGIEYTLNINLVSGSDFLDIELDR
ncbi:MAG: LamG domain-containing protein [Candidatus Nanohaloarchaeota archaeon QJJ-9]|nr:LamG domain-containing protein [Candidatus Nanohaloarchaeota archaeon QJJ-9]